MKNKYFLENRNSMYIVSEVMALSYKYYSLDMIRSELSVLLAECRAYNSVHRNNGYDYLNSLSCGYQDSHVEAVERMFQALEVFKTLYRMKQGDMTRLTYWYDKAIGRE